METKFIDIVVDLETLSTKTDAVIMQVGAIALEYPNDNASCPQEFDCSISVASNFKYDRQVDVSTITFWKEQPTQTWANVANGTLELPVVLAQFAAWIKHVRDQNQSCTLRIWGNASAFDLGILKSAYEAIAADTPWHYREEMCLRTLCKMFPEVEKERSTYAHVALWDARAELATLQKLLVRIDGLQNKKEEQ